MRVPYLFNAGLVVVARSSRGINLPRCWRSVSSPISETNLLRQLPPVDCKALQPNLTMLNLKVRLSCSCVCTYQKPSIHLLYIRHGLRSEFWRLTYARPPSDGLFLVSEIRKKKTSSRYGFRSIFLYQFMSTSCSDGFFGCK